MAKVFGEKSGMERLRIAQEASAQARERLIAFLTASLRRGLRGAVHLTTPSESEPGAGRF